MKLLAITDRKSLDRALRDFLRRALEAGVDAVQLREKDLAPGELYRLARDARALPNPHGARLLVNGRTDVALAAGLDGVHLPSAAVSPEHIRAVAPDDFHIGVSCHSLEDLQRAESEGADYAVFSPVFPTASKPGYGPPLGLPALEQACAVVRIPVFALGGVTAANARACIEAGAQGIAGISLFQQAADLSTTVRALRSGRC